MSDRLKIKLGDYILDNPIIPASGTFGYGYEFSDYYDLNILGSICMKATTLQKRYGNELPRIADCPSGMLNSIGMQNPGVDKVINEELVKLSKVYNKKVIINVGGESIKEFVSIVRKFENCTNVFAVELNISCPNVKDGGIVFGTNPKLVYDLVMEVRKNTSKFLIVKLSPNVNDVISIAKSCEYAKADAISLVNTYLGVRINLNTRKPILSREVGGYSGPGIFPMVVKLIRDCYKNVNIPIIGMGGVMNASNVIELMMAGASAVMVGTANLIDPYVCNKIINQLEKEMDKYKIDKLVDVIGVSNE